jgi:hypothetical protein
MVPDLAKPVVAVSLGGLRRKIEAIMLPDIVDLRLVLDVRARRERDRRRRGGDGRASDYGAR